MNWMSHWGVIGNPAKFVGKTIVAVETLRMEYGSTHNECVLFKFHDGSRGWIFGGNSSGIAVNPDESSLNKSMIITPEEYGEYQSDKLRRKQTRDQNERLKKIRQLEDLKKELGIAE